MSTKTRLKKRGPVAAKNGAADEMPVIAWDKMTIMDVLEMTARQDESTEQNVIAAKIQAQVADKEDFERLDYLRSREYQLAMIEKQMEDMAKYVTSVPRNWFVNSAPEKLDFDKADSYKFLQPQRFFQLHQMLIMNNAQADAASKN